MSEIKKEVLKKEVFTVLKEVDASSITAKKLRKILEDKLEVDLTDRKNEIEQLLQAYHKKGKKNGDVNDDSEAEDEEADNDEDDEDEEEEQVKKSKRTAAKKASGKRRRGSSDESEESASDDDYSPKKKSTAKKGGKRGRKKKTASSDNESDEDWSKGKKSSKKPGAKRSGGGYTKPVTLSADLAELLGESSMPRHEVVKRIWGIIKERNLYDPKNKQFAICDDELLKIFGVKRFRTFGMMKFLKNHFTNE